MHLAQIAKQPYCRTLAVPVKACARDIHVAAYIGDGHTTACTCELHAVMGCCYCCQGQQGMQCIMWQLPFADQQL